MHAFQSLEAIKQELVAGLSRAIPPGTPVALLDVPVYRNPGDLFIYLATLRFFRDRGQPLVCESSLRDYRTSTVRRRIPADAVLISLGGGNLGDLYPAYQALRERIVADFPRHRIVVLPQTIFFRSEAALRRCATTFQHHEDLWLLVRDRSSYELAESRLATNVSLLPDMAHYLWPLTGEPVPQAPAGTLYLLRRDLERRVLPSDVAAHSAEFTDWQQVLPVTGVARLGLIVAGLKLAPTARTVDSIYARWRRHVERVLRRCARTLAGYEHIVSNRLHGHLLALLVGRPSDVIDNSYGKLSAYVRCWTQGLDGVRLLETAGQQPGLLRERTTR